jgi:hypothetical protein
MKEFVRTLEQAGLQTIVVGEKVIVLPFGGRIIGLFPDLVHNALWVNPKLHDPKEASSYISDPGWGGWANLGGDRTWISPEIDTHVEDPKRLFETYKVLPDVDPASYKVVGRDGKSVTLTAQMRIRFQRAKVDVTLRVTKKISSIDAPTVPVVDGVAFAGYALEISLEALSGLPSSVHPGIWNILQVPGSGRILIPVRSGVMPRTFFGTPGFSIEKGLISCPVSSSENLKFALRARHSTGWILYERDDTDSSTLIVRRYSLGDDAEYFDVAYDDPSGAGYATEVYVDDGNLGGFGEMEYHSPGIISSKGRSITDTSKVWAFRGPGDAVEKIRQIAVEVR